MDNFARERIAGEFLKHHGINDDHPHRAELLNAFCTGFTIVNERFQKLRNECKKQDHTHLCAVADKLDAEFDEI